VQVPKNFRLRRALVMFLVRLHHCQQRPAIPKFSWPPPTPIPF